MRFEGLSPFAAFGCFTSTVGAAMPYRCPPTQTLLVMINR
jgi:hypothetical protein